MKGWVVLIMMEGIVEVSTELQVNDVVKLADEIWHEHYSTIISDAQICYMLEQFQSVSAIQTQIEKGYRYFLIYDEELPAGYCSIRYDRKDGRLFLSKIYVRKESRRKGLGNRLFSLVMELAKEAGLCKVWLTVNRNNSDSVQIYKRKGFLIDHEEDNEIGEGFIMSDYIMECPL